MEIIKNKNWLDFTLTDSKRNDKNYRYNINDGCFYGPSGKALKNYPTGLKRQLEYSSCNTNYNTLIAIVSGFCCQLFTRYIPGQAKEVSLFYDKLLTLGYKTIDAYDDEFARSVKYAKYIGQYRSVESENFKPELFNRYAEMQEIKQMPGLPALKSLDNGMLNHVLREIFTNRRIFEFTPTFEEAEILAYYLTKGYINDAVGTDTYYHNDLQNLVIKYMNMCHKIDKPYNKTPNFLRELAETRREWLLRKAELDKIAFAKNYNMHPDAWNFTYGNYTIRIPTIGEDLIQEGKKMHHCVGGYVEKVANNQTYICFVRDVADPETPYITCQVGINGDIQQYYLAHDNHISSDEDKEFKRAFQQYLNKVW